MADLSQKYTTQVTAAAVAASQGGLNVAADAAALAAQLDSINAFFSQAHSTSWEDIYNQTKTMTPDQALAFYIQGIKTGKLDNGHFNQWSELYGNKADKGGNSFGGKSRVKELHYDIAKQYNDLYVQMFPTDPSIKENLIDLNKTIQPSVVAQSVNSLYSTITNQSSTTTSTIQQAKTPVDNTKILIYAGIGVAALIAVVLIVK